MLVQWRVLSSSRISRSESQLFVLAQCLERCGCAVHTLQHVCAQAVEHVSQLDLLSSEGEQLANSSSEWKESEVAATC